MTPILSVVKCIVPIVNWDKIKRFEVATKHIYIVTPENHFCITYDIDEVSFTIMVSQIENRTPMVSQITNQTPMVSQITNQTPMTCNELIVAEKDWKLIGKTSTIDEIVNIIAALCF